MASFTVNNNNDNGVGSLRQAIADANAAIGLDTIEFDNSLSGQQITLTSGELQITDGLTINGLGANLLTVSGNNASRVFLIDDGESSVDQIDVTLDGLTITEGVPINSPGSVGGGGIVNFENLTVLNSNISDNASSGITSLGGNLEIVNSLISENDSGGISATGGTIEVIQSTISGNIGRGISLYFADSDGLKLSDSIISDNIDSGISAFRSSFEVNNSLISGNTGAGIDAFRSNSTISNSQITNNKGGGAVSSENRWGISNSIVVDNFDDSSPYSERQPDISGSVIISDGYNFIGDITGITGINPFTEPGDLFGTSANPLSLSQIIEGTSGDDYLEGTAGIDRIAGGNGNDTLRGRDGIDVLLGEAGHDRLFGDGGENTLSGGAGDDELFGGVDNDYLEGGDGNDTLYGGAGNDQLFGNADDDRLVGNDGNDSIYGGAGVDILVGQNGHDYLEGNDGNDTLYGGAGNDQLFGNANDDRFFAGDGDDTLYGGLGQDVLNGDAGSDRFVLVSGVSADQDIIRDYQDGVDRLILTGDLSFNDLDIVQSGSNTRIREAATNQTLAILNGTDFNDLNQHDFEFGAGSNGIRVEAEDYVHFSDTTGGNTGGVYRNDDVDLEVTTDIGGGFNVGWIADGEWLTYNVNLAASGSYQVVARVASNTTDGRVHHLDVSLDGQSTTLDFNATGGWQSWTDISGGNLNLSAGSHELRLDMGSSGFNINYVDLIPLDDSAIISFVSNELLGSELFIVDDTLADF